MLQLNERQARKIQSHNGKVSHQVRKGPEPDLDRKWDSYPKFSHRTAVTAEGMTQTSRKLAGILGVAICFLHGVFDEGSPSDRVCVTIVLRLSFWKSIEKNHPIAEEPLLALRPLQSARSAW